jgi:hypothetical protein
MQFKPRFLLFILLLFAGTGAWAQVGSLGDPVFSFDFGSGNTPQLPVTNYQYVAGSCPEDGQYSISKTETGCHDDTWHKVLKDHTGNDGYMMVVNADATPGKEFFSKQTTFAGGDDALCPNTTYEFSAYILNLIKAGLSGFTQPQIILRIEKVSGGLIAQSPVIDIPATSNPDGWQKYSIFFNSQGETAVVVKILNNAPGGQSFPGNDLLLDDIAFRAYGPVVQAGIPNDAGEISTAPGNHCVGVSKQYIIKSSPINDPTYKYQWQQNINGAGWADITTPPETTPTLIRDFPATQPAGTYQYRLGVAVGNNITSPSCRVYSNTFTINVNPLPNPPEFQPKILCEGDLLSLPATGGSTYIWTLPDMSTTSQNPFVISQVTGANAGRYTVEVKSAAGCSVSRYVDVTVNSKPIIDMDDFQPACKGVGVPLMASVQNPGTDTYTYSWLPATGLTDAGKADPIANPNVTTDYTVTVTNNRTGCSAFRHVLVTVLDVPVASAGSDKKCLRANL